MDGVRNAEDLNGRAIWSSAPHRVGGRFYHLAFTHEQQPVCTLDKIRVVSDHEHGLAILAHKFYEEMHDATTRLIVKIARRLISQHKNWIVSQSSNEGDPLLLAAGLSVGVAVRPIDKAYPIEKRPRTGFSTILSSGQLHRKQHVFQDCQRINQVEGLKHKADAMAPEVRELPLVHAGDIDSTDLYTARRRAIETSQKVEKRTLAGSAASKQDRELALAQLEINSAQNTMELIAFLEIFRDGVKPRRRLFEGQCLSTRILQAQHLTLRRLTGSVSEPIRATRPDIYASNVICSSRIRCPAP